MTGPMEASQSNNRRLLMILLAAASSFMLFQTTERCFAEADIRNAITLAQHLRASGDAETIPAMLAREHNVEVKAITWTGIVTDNHYGFVRVRAAVPGPKDVIEYFFDVNLAGQRLHPANDLARNLMRNLIPESGADEGGAPGAEASP